MTEPGLPDNPINIKSILKDSAELLHSNPNKEHQSLEQRVESLERKVAILSKTVARLTKQPKDETKTRKSKTLSSKTEERIRRIKDAAKDYWMSRVDGKPISKRRAAIQNRFATLVIVHGKRRHQGEPNVLSKRESKPYMEPIEKKYGGILSCIARLGEEKKDEIIRFINDILG